MSPAGTGVDEARSLDRLIARDQFDAVRRSVRIAIPVNMLLGLAGLVVAIRAGDATIAAPWYAASLAVNLLRLALCRTTADDLGAAGSEIDETAAAAVERWLRRSWLAALASGIVWSFVPLLCDGDAGTRTLFFFTVLCGITAGAVTHGTAYARVPACFCAPPLLATAAWLFSAGEFDRTCLGATVLLYLLALLRASHQCEAMFRAASRAKNEATALARSLQEAHGRTSFLVDTMRERATHDALTGLLNRAGFLQALDERATPDRPACLLLLDLDGFKSVNDIYGHKTGDRVLAEMGRRFAQTAPPGALVARLGGDEFAVSYDPEAADLPADALAARLIGAATQPFERIDAGRLGASIGLHRAAADPTEMLSCADEALYAAKRAGRNRARHFDADLRRRLDVRCGCERDIVQALAAREIEVWFQPIHGDGGRRLAGFEALVRWHHPEYGWIAPPELIAAASAAGVAEPLLRYILDAVCDLIGVLRARGLADVGVAMNVSPREMSQLAVDAIVLARLSDLGLPAAALEIEITEEIALDVSAVRDKLAKLSRAGVRLAIDDFGVGYSSLAFLRQLRADRIKIDRSFVTGLADSEDNQGLVQAILGLARSMRVEVVAEGVETARDLEALRAAGCLLMQGYHLGRPEPAATVLASLPADRWTAA